ncbi:MAG: hypothetical protein QOF48_1696, partial [Verrucomicrobiota bacterium]
GVLISMVNEAGLPGNRVRPLIASLKAATASFDRGDTKAGLNQLGAFLHKVRAQISSSNQSLADSLNRVTQIISDAAVDTSAR